MNKVGGWAESVLVSSLLLLSVYINRGAGGVQFAGCDVCWLSWVLVHATLVLF